MLSLLCIRATIYVHVLGTSGEVPRLRPFSTAAMHGPLVLSSKYMAWSFRPIPDPLWIPLYLFLSLHHAVRLVGSPRRLLCRAKELSPTIDGNNWRYSCLPKLKLYNTNIFFIDKRKINPHPQHPKQ
jgi:hypothetical protein